MPNLEEYTALLVAGSSLLAILLKHFGPDSRVRSGQVQLEGRLVKIETQLGLIWKGVEQNLTQLLKQPTHLRKDELLDKMQNGVITKPEARELNELLKQELDSIDASKVLAITFIQARLYQILED